MARAQVRRRRRTLTLLTILVGLIGGFSISLIAGASRSATVVDRFSTTAKRYDLELFDQSAALTQRVVLTYVMALSARVRMRDLAVLRALGLPARQLRSVLTWEGAIAASGMVLIGVPAGLLLGSVLWARVADPLGLQRTAVVPPLIVLLAPFVLLAAVGASLAPARRARREEVAELLRAY